MALAVRFYDDYRPAPGNYLREEVLAGFARQPKSTSPALFYDRRGSELFDRICQQPEYYVTRTEEGILASAADEIAERVGPSTDLVELGSGASRKVRLLLEALHPTSYLGVDISEDFLLASTQRLAADYPWLYVSAACADFTDGMRLPPAFETGHPLMFFPGSSIGNFTPAQACRLLRKLHGLMPAGGSLLVGVDLIKDRETLEAAYNDRAQVTAAFNLNLLERIREELASDIDPSRFAHRAFFNDVQSRIEMHLVSREPQDVTIEGRRFHFEAGESLHTENSYKYSLDSFARLAHEAGLEPVACWTDPDRLFSVQLLRPQGALHS